MQNEASEWEKIFVSYVLNKRLVCRLQNQFNKKRTTPLQICKKSEQIFCLKNPYK